MGQIIQIDDSLWGSLVGGVMIGMYHTGTKQFYSEIIPVTYFRKGQFDKKTYLAKASTIVLKGFSILESANHIQVCRGYSLKGVRETLRKMKNKTVECIEITGSLQSLLEQASAKYLHRIGLPLSSGGAHCISFEKQLEWVKEKPKRVKFVKTGWKSWKNKYSLE